MTATSLSTSPEHVARIRPGFGRIAVLLIALGVVFSLVALLPLLPHAGGDEASAQWSVSTGLVFAGWAATTIVLIAVALIRATRRIDS